MVACGEIADIAIIMNVEFYSITLEVTHIF